MAVCPLHWLLVAATALALVSSGCASIDAGSVTALAVDSEVTVEGTIASIDTQPWTYDGNAVVVLDTARYGQVSVQLPARWNLCKAAPVDVTALVVGQPARGVGTVTAAGELLVCPRPEHRLEMAD